MPHSHRYLNYLAWLRTFYEMDAQNCSTEEFNATLSSRPAYPVATERLIRDFATRVLWSDGVEETIPDANLRVWESLLAREK